MLLGRAGSLPSCARILSGLREDFLRGVGKLTSVNFVLLDQLCNEYNKAVKLTGGVYLSTLDVSVQFWHLLLR